MKSLKQELFEYLSECLVQMKSENVVLTFEDISISQRASFGDYQINVAMKWAKILKQMPRDIASDMVRHIESDSLFKDYFDHIDIAGPGFINLWLSKHKITQYLNASIKNNFLKDSKHNKQTVVVDYSSPNVAKTMHVGHLRSTIIGDAIANLHDYLGFDVERINHIGDWGTQFGMLLMYISNNISQEQLDLPLDTEKLVKWYRDAKQYFDDDEEFKKGAKAFVHKLQSGEEYSGRVWKRLCEVSKRDYDKIYQRLGVNLKVRGESYYQDTLQSIVDECVQRGIATISDGAVCIFLEGEQIPFMIQKSDKGFNYATTDLAALKHRIYTVKAKKIFYLTDLGQQLHFRQLFAVSKKLGWLDESLRATHVPFGLVLREDKKKFRTRSGENVNLSTLLDEAVTKASEVIAEKNNNIVSDDDANVLGISAIKYADLSCPRQSDYVFSLSKMLSFDGNTSCFINYSYVRINSIITKSTATHNA
ncbi:arginine--tRNA ligase, partial [Chlamydiia bacterium]|nr:arginine--tRNA ligase [Chlamydiia bacterium]